MGKKFLILGMIPLWIATVFAVEVKKVKIQGFDEFNKGTFTTVILTGDGTLMIGPKTNKIVAPEDEFLLSLEQDEKHNLYIGTGHGGTVFKVAEGTNKMERIFKGDELDIYALTVLRSGDLLVGTSPSGKIYKVTQDKKKSVFFDPRERMIWDIVEDQSRNIYCALGVQGAVYKLSQSGTGKKIPGLDDFHILRLFVTKDNRLLIGTGENGVLFEYKNNKSKVLFDTPYNEIKGICEDDSGNIYFSATSGGYISTPVKTAIPQLPEPATGIIPKVKPVKPTFYRSILYKMDRSGVVEEIWKLKKDYIYDLAWDSQNKGVVVTTGNSGRIFRIGSEDEITMLYEGDFSQAYKVVTGSNGIYFISNNGTGAYKMGYNSAQRGEYLSRVYDMKVKSLLGKIYWNRGYKSGSGLSMSVRMGNASTPDASWTEWSAPYTDQENSNVNISGFRYFQVKAVFNDLNLNTPVKLHNIYLYYLQSNIKPKIKQIFIKPGVKEKAKLLISRWITEDKNSDRLNFKVEIKKVNDVRWIQLKTEYARKDLTLDPKLFSDGIYQMKITGSDSQDNPRGAKESIKVSDPFIIDSSAPMVSQLLKDKGSLTFKVTDSVSVIYKVQYSYDRLNWFSIFPEDKINDSREENFKIGISAGKSYLFIKVIDESLNEKVFQKAL